MQKLQESSDIGMIDTGCHWQHDILIHIFSLGTSSLGNPQHEFPQMRNPLISETIQAVHRPGWHKNPTVDNHFKIYKVYTVFFFMQ